MHVDAMKTKQFFTRSTIVTAAGLALVFLGLYWVTGTLIRGENGGDAALVQGVWLFRAGLVVIGAYLLLLRVLPINHPENALETGLASASRSQTMIFMALLICAAALRFYNLDTGIWYDEMLMSVNYMPLTVGQIVSTFHDANNHVLYSALARLSFSVFGDGVWVLRLPAVGFGIGCVVALYYFARRVGPTSESLFAVALMTFSYHHIWFSQNARGYTALLFFSILSSAWLLDALRQGTPRKWGLYCLAVVLGAYTHLTMGLMVMAHFAIWATALFRPTAQYAPYRWNGLLYGFIPIGLLTFQVYALILPDLVGGALLNSGLQGAGSEWTNPLWALAEIFRSLQVGFASGGVVLVAGVIFALGLLDFVRRRPAVVALFLVPVVIGFTMMTSIGYTLFPRFFFFTFGFAIVIVIRGAAVTGRFGAQLIRVPDAAARWVPALLCAGIVAVSVMSLRHVYLPKQDYAGAIDLIEQEMRADDTVLTVGIADFPFNGYYQKGWKTVMTVEDLESLESQTGRTWLVYTMPVQVQSAHPELLARIESDYTVVQRFYGSLGGGDVVVNLENHDTGARAGNDADSVKGIDE